MATTAKGRAQGKTTTAKVAAGESMAARRKSSGGPGGSVAADAPARERGPAKSRTKPKASTKSRKLPPDPLTPDEARALIRATSSWVDSTGHTVRCTGDAGVRDKALVVLLYRAGVRIGEALALFPRDVDLATGDIRVLHGKGDKQRVVRMADTAALAVLERWMRRRTKLGISARAPLFCTISAGEVLEPGKPLSQSHVRHMLRRLAKRAGITRRVHPHGLRHTWASELLREGVPLGAISGGLGHVRISTTEVYAKRLQPEELLKALGQRPAWTP